MVAQSGAVAAKAASANDIGLPSEGIVALVQFVAAGLTPAMRATLALRQSDMFGRDCLAGGAPITIKALERRGLVEGRTLRITEIGEMVADTSERPSAARPASPNPDALATPVAGVSETRPIGPLRSGQSTATGMRA